jgi:hypothetical protein
MKLCPLCEKELADNLQYCTRCGTMVTMPAPIGAERVRDIADEERRFIYGPDWWKEMLGVIIGLGVSLFAILLASISAAQGVSPFLICGGWVIGGGWAIVRIGKDPVGYRRGIWGGIVVGAGLFLMGYLLYLCVLVH